MSCINKYIKKYCFYLLIITNKLLIIKKKKKKKIKRFKYLNIWYSYLQSVLLLLLGEFNHGKYYCFNIYFSYKV